MFFSIDPNSGVAIYEQIVRQVKFAIAEGILQPGQLLPSVRTLSQKLAINANTIAKAFQQLQNDGMLDSLRGRGLVVRADAIASCKAARRELIEERLQTVIAEALHAGMTARELRKIVIAQIEQLDGTVATVAANEDE